MNSFLLLKRFASESNTNALFMNCCFRVLFLLSYIGPDRALKAGNLNLHVVTPAFIRILYSGLLILMAAGKEACRLSAVREYRCFLLGSTLNLSPDASVTGLGRGGEGCFSPFPHERAERSQPSPHQSASQVPSFFVCFIGWQEGAAGAVAFRG